MNNKLTYSDDGLMNRVLFLSENNDICVIVEDEGKEYEYERIFKRMFEDELSINDIFPMGGKEGVKLAFNKYGELYNSKPIIYLVDGDFDLMLQKQMNSANNFIYLDKYNIESYYVEKTPVIRYMAGKLKETEREVEKIIEYDKWEEDTYRKLEKLFLNYVIVQDKFPSEKSVGISPHCYLDDKGFVDIQKVDDYVFSIHRRLSNYSSVFDKYRNRYISELEGDKTRLICGKYVICSLATYLRKKARVSFKEDDFKYFLICEFDIAKLNFLKIKIRSIISNSSNIA